MTYSYCTVCVPIVSPSVPVRINHHPCRYTTGTDENVFRVPSVIKESWHLDKSWVVGSRDDLMTDDWNKEVYEEYTEKDRVNSYCMHCCNHRRCLGLIHTTMPSILTYSREPYWWPWSLTGHFGQSRSCHHVTVPVQVVNSTVPVHVQ